MIIKYIVFNQYKLLFFKNNDLFIQNIKIKN